MTQYFCSMVYSPVKHRIQDLYTVQSKLGPEHVFVMANSSHLA